MKQRNMTFGEALEAVKAGELIAREGWNGKGMAVAFQPGYPAGIPANRNTSNTWKIPGGSPFKCRPYLQLRCADGSYQMWVASQTDLLEEDWYLVN